ncbi:uncharacterized protein BDW47DRAFT_128414 [Aspergillus candidus]|uniref:Uncharacterized protein n=1 Tax=Aspergillus candidus TaxID=41067 RepID=A0A2I2F3C0_ASPCN|nr:hypothetical protein BDW47DRAFT_128414 [Aspergillus candidus]PLB35088.1 hypothetical protein BDW47DRAFT_128414 [Aspergillus candidus]
MLPIRLLRTIPSVRPVASSPSPWLQLISGQRIPSYVNQTRPITTTQSTLFSSSSPISSSPFRLNSNNTTTPPTNPEHDTPDSEYASDKYAPYKPKRTWPPDMRRLSPKHQFRLERKYRRRAALKFARPQWMKITKLVQWGVISFVVLYAVLFMEWDERGSPFDDLRNAVFGAVKGAFSTPAPPRPVQKGDQSRD